MHQSVTALTFCSCDPNLLVIKVLVNDRVPIGRPSWISCVQDHFARQPTKSWYFPDVPVSGVVELRISQHAAVRRPTGTGFHGGVVCDLHRFPAVHKSNIDVVMPVAIGDVRDGASV